MLSTISKHIGNNFWQQHFRIAKKVVLSKVHQALGFERAKGWYSSAAPLSDDVFQYFQSLDMPIQVGNDEMKLQQAVKT